MLAKLFNIQEDGPCRFRKRNRINAGNLESFGSKTLIDLVPIEVESLLMIKEEAIIVEILYKTVQFAGVGGDAVQEVVVPYCVELQSYTHEIYV